MFSAVQNIFKKKPQLQSVVSQVPKVASTALRVSSPTVNSILGVGGAAKKLTSSLPRPAQAAQTPSQSMSSAPIQGSGYGSQYSSNQGNYPKPTPAPTTQYPTQPSFDQSAQRQQEFARTQQKQKEDYIRQQYGLLNQQLDQSIPQYQADFQAYKGNTEASIADLLASGEREKSGARDYHGEAQRLAAQTRRETQGQTQRTFANLGTLDSRGEGSFQQATENADSDFNRFTQQNLKAQADKLAEIDSRVGTAEREARLAISSEERKMNGLIQQIRLAQQQNKLDEVQSLTEAYNQSQQYIYDVEDSLNQMKYTLEMERQKASETKPLSAEQQAQLSDIDNSVNQVNNLQNLIVRYGSKFGPLAGMQALNPYDTDAQAVRSQIKAVAQMVGRALEGGVLRAEDVPKYEAILPQITDRPEVAQRKIASVVSLLEGQRNSRTSGFSQIGYSTSAPNTASSGVDPAVTAFLQSMGM